ncbi:MAG: GspH/FimT family pseudopilin [Gemmatimonadales bacterium]
MTLLETFAVVTTAAILTAIVVSGAARQADRAQVTLAQAAIVDAHRIGRSAAQALNRPVEVVVTADSIVVRDPADPDQAPMRRRAGPGRMSVTVSPASHTATYSANGLATGIANVTHRLQRGAVQRTVVVSRLGRLRVE